MARPRKYDRSVLVDKAMEVFWSLGYEGVSVQQLGEALGIHPGSFYDTFSDKHSLFLEVLDAYDQQARRSFNEVLNTGDSPKKALSQLFQWVADRLALPANQRGCLMINTAVELSLYDAEVARKVSGHHQWIAERFRQTLQQAVDKHEIEARTPEELLALAQFLVCSLHGMRVMAKMKISRESLAQVARHTLSALK